MTPISLLILDLDNTLFDWIGEWHFDFLVERNRILRRFSDAASAEATIKRLHQKYRTSEYRFLYSEIVASRHKKGPRIKRSIRPLDDLRPNRRNPMYPGIRASLRRIRADGARIVICTESLQGTAERRLAQFGLDGLIETLYCRRDHPLPRILRSNYSTLRKTFLKQTKVVTYDVESTKPDPQLLQTILDDVNITPDKVAYIGDSLSKDIAMAKSARVLDVWAQYGNVSFGNKLSTLRQVSHWRTIEIRQHQHVSHLTLRPTLTLAKRFDEIFDHIVFERAAPTF